MTQEKELAYVATIVFENGDIFRTEFIANPKNEKKEFNILIDSLSKMVFGGKMKKYDYELKAKTNES